MDFQSMRDKVEKHMYKSMDEFEYDFVLIVNNCMTYNAKDTVFYRAAVKLRDQVSVSYTLSAGCYTNLLGVTLICWVLHYFAEYYTNLQGVTLLCRVLHYFAGCCTTLLGATYSAGCYTPLC